MSIFPPPSLKSEGTWHNYETGAVTDPAEIAKLEAARAAEIKAAKDAEERIRIANETGEIRFSSGHTMTPNCGIIGLSHDLEIFDGYDGSANIWESDQYGAPSVEDTPIEDLHELADIMIDRWQRFKASLETK